MRFLITYVYKDRYDSELIVSVREVASVRNPTCILRHKHIFKKKESSASPYIYMVLYLVELTSSFVLALPRC